MTDPDPVPDFDQFSRWLKAKWDKPRAQAESYSSVYVAAQEARNAFVAGRNDVNALTALPNDVAGSVEVVQLLAAADGDAVIPPELTTALGFRIHFSFGGAADQDSLVYVLIYCPSDRVADLTGSSAHLWIANERFAMGQFDAEGKTLGALPAGVSVTAADFLNGTISLETRPQ